MNNEFIAKTEPLNYDFPVFGGNFDAPAIMLAKKDKTIVGSVDYTDLRFTFNLNAFQTVTFKIYRELDGKIQKYFDSFEDGMLIVIPGISWYEIHVETDTDNAVITKTVTGTSLECKLCDKRLFDFQVNSDDFEDEDYAKTTFYNPMNPKKSLLNRVLNVTPNWRVGHVDQSLMDMQRTFDESDIDVYSFLTGNVAEAFNCLFVFDTFDCTVNAYDLDNYGNDTKIFVDSENLVTTMTQKIDENSIITCYRVVGGDYVEIAEVNPNGSNKIYNFSYYLSQMPQEIQDKINAYNTKFQSLKPQYEDVIVQMQNQLEIIQELYTRIPDSETSTDWTKYGLELLQNREKSYQNVHDVYCAQGMNNPQSLNYNLYQENIKLLNGVKAEIGVRETEIESAQNVWQSINGEMLDIQGQLDMNKWFSEEEWKTLDDYVIEATYSNDNFSIFNNTSEAELLSVEKELYDAAWNDLSKKCRPKYQYSATLMNLLAMEEFKELAKHFKLGNFIRTKTEYGALIKLRIISFTVDYSKAGLIDVTFSDATKVDVQGVCDDTADILAQAHSAAMSFKFNKDQYDSSVKQGNFVSEMRKNGLDVAITNIHNSSNQSQVWDETGMTFRQWNAQKNDFDPEMIKIINNQMVFSDDGLKTARMALGKISLGNGEYGYGLNAEVLMSKLVMSENLYLENNSGTYKFTDDGFIASNGTNSIKIQPNKSNELFSLYKGDDQNFYIDSDGDIWLRGNLSGGSINIGNGNFTVDSNGYMTATGGTFNGNINASNFSGGTINGTTISGGTVTGASITGNTISGGTISGTTITGGSINIGTGFSVDSSGNMKSISGEFVSATFKNTIFYGLDYNGQSYYFSVIDVPKPGYITFGLTNAHTTFPGSVQFDNYLIINQDMSFGSGATTYGTSAGTTNSKLYKTANGGNENIPSAGWVKDYVSSNVHTTSIIAQYTIAKGSNGYGSSLIQFSNATSGRLAGATAEYVQTYIANYTSSSDRRLKKNIEKMRDISDLYMELNPVEYKWQDGYINSHKGLQFGLVAQDVEQVLIKYNLYNSDLVLRDESIERERAIHGDVITYKVDKENLHAMHIQMIQSQQKEIESLKQQNISLEGRIAILEQHNEVVQKEVYDLKQEIDDLKQLVNKLLERDSV